MKQRIDVSTEMVSFVGPGALPAEGWPAEARLFCFEGLEDGAPMLVCLDETRREEAEDASLVLVVAAEACRRIFATEPEAGGPWILPGSLRDLARTIRDYEAPDLARQTLRLAKSIEALCMIFDHRRRGSLVPLTGAAISSADAERIVAARRMIDDRCHEKLTLNGIARACGLSRGKLARGFRAMFHTSVADAITERRLAGAQRMLRQTDLPVKAIGYRCGYLNNAAFTRAFSRHVGLAPTRYRAEALAA